MAILRDLSTKVKYIATPVCTDIETKMKGTMHAYSGEDTMGNRRAIISSVHCIPSTKKAPFTVNCSDKNSILVYN